MKQTWFAGALGAIALVSGTAWTPFGVARAVSFTPPPGRSAPQQAAGGASRGIFFTPPPGRSAPRQATGGASRGSFFTPHPEQSAPQQTAGGASRTDSYGMGPDLIGADNTHSMLALIPKNLYGTTLQARPTILVYVPASSAQEGIFSLKDGDKNVIYQMAVPVSTEGSVIAVTLPESAPALAVDQNYQWFFALKQEDLLRPDSPFVNGWVQRIQPNAQESQSLAQEDPIEHIAAMGSQGIWYDAAAELAAMHAGQSDEAIAQHWKELLESVGLVNIATAPVVMH